MTSSNRHWPSLFKSKPYTAQHWQGDVNSSTLSTAFAKPPYTPAAGSEERAPEPKPRWNPKPEQIRILEGIFNSGMVNPPRDEIRRIRMQLQEYGQVGDANIFYWFQNHKSRSKHKQRLQQQSSKHHQSAVPPVSTAACSSSSSSSDPSTPLLAEPPKKAPPESSPTASVEQAAPAQKHGAPEAAALDVSPTGFWSELVCQHDCRGGSRNNAEDEEGKAKLLLHSLYGTLPSASSDTIPSTATAANLFSPILPNYMATVSNPVVTNDDVFQGASMVGFGEFGGGATAAVAARPTVVFINEVAFEVGASPVNIREAFGNEALLFSSSGLPVLVDEWGVTLQPLQPGASYYLV